MSHHQGVSKEAEPSTQELVAVLEKLSGFDDLPMGVRLADLGVDSMDILEWLFTLEERFDVEFDELLGESTELEAFGDVTLSELCDAVLELARRAR